MEARAFGCRAVNVLKIIVGAMFLAAVIYFSAGIFTGKYFLAVQLAGSPLTTAALIILSIYLLRSSIVYTLFSLCAMLHFASFFLFFVVASGTLICIAFGLIDIEKMTRVASEESSTPNPGLDEAKSILTTKNCTLTLIFVSVYLLVYSSVFAVCAIAYWRLAEDRYEVNEPTYTGSGERISGENTYEGEEEKSD